MENKVLDLFKGGFLEEFLEENEHIEKIIFFGSYVKGTEHGESDLDIILIPTGEYLKETEEDDMERISTLLGLHADLREGLKSNILLDVKFQEFFDKKEQYGLTYITNNAVATFYSFIKGEIGKALVVSKNHTLSFESF